MGMFRETWLRWKMLKLPWRKQFLIGQDLAGNTFWEFKDQINHNRLRRIVQYRRGTHHSEVQVSPQWHQWLRQTRSEPPTIQEQATDIQRQIQLKYNARLADERWAAKARYIEKPKQSPAKETGEAAPASGNGSEATTDRSKSSPKPSDRGDDPWKQANDAGSTSSSNWQPEAWTPGPKGIKR